MKVRPLKERYRANGFTYRLLQREGNVALYEVSLETKTKCENRGFEVHLMRTIKVTPFAISRNPSLQEWDAMEINPSNEDFGTYGWYYQTKERALECYYKKINEQEEKKDERSREGI